MIKRIEKTITEELSDRYELRGQKIFFLKYNTPLSGTGLGNKIIFFVFLEHADTPFLIVKTVRSYRDADVVSSGYTKLSSLNNLTQDSPFSVMFPKALLLHHSGREIWSVETVCGGRRASINDLKRIVSVYGLFSQYIKKNSSGSVTLDVGYGEDLLRQFSGAAKTLAGLQQHLIGLWRDHTLVLPRLPQHGDLTLDNIFIDHGAVKIIDCDLFGDIVLPGFDMFHLLARSDVSAARSFKLAEYFQNMNIDIVPDEKLLFMYFLQEMLVKKDYIFIDRTAAEIIGQWRDIIVSRGLGA